MPEFSNHSLEQLRTCHPDLQMVFMDLIEFVDCRVIQGYRSKEEQNRFFREKKSKVQWPNSKHNTDPSLAVDVAPGRWMNGQWIIPWTNTELFRAFGGYVLGFARAYGIELRWGGDWDSDWNFRDQRFNDLVHFELVSRVTRAGQNFR